jgi:hypothetical protein
MHAFILLVWAFYSPVGGNPETIKVAPGIFQTLDQCKSEGELTASSVSQMKGVIESHYICVEVVNDKDTVA